MRHCVTHSALSCDVKRKDGYATLTKGWQGSPWGERNLRCAGVLFRQAKSMFVNTLMMLNCGRAAWYGWTRGGSLFKPCVPLCSQPMRNTTILVQAMTHNLQSSSKFAMVDMAWSAHYIITMARTSTLHLPWRPWMQFQPQQGCIGEPSHWRLVLLPSHPEVDWSIQFLDLLFTQCA